MSRGARQCLGAALLWLLVVGIATPATADDIDAVTAVALTVSDLDAAQRFYGEVLDFKTVDERELSGVPYERLYGVFGLRLRSLRMRLGAEEIELQQFLTAGGRPIPADMRSNDLAFQHIAIIVADMATAYARLREHHVHYGSSEPQRLPDWNPNAGGIEAFYFRDPDGHYLEILHFPSGKGAARWQQADGHLFLGIDHTAIVVADTDRSLAFYRDTLGLKVAGTSENWGTEQEHLNNVFGAHLRITALRAAVGPGIELLQYLAPQGGRPSPADTRANDLWHWHVVMQGADVNRLDARLLQARYLPVSSDLVNLPASRARMYRDADGHAIMVQQAILQPTPP